ncbi:MAG: M56 family metallopeptidase [Bacteroidales bacterium]|nr:M56 family metallopeptidase [Candidatus Egerieousia equi]
MITFLAYEIKVAVIITVFYLFYRIMLSRETLHRLNRAILMSTVFIAFILPFCVITIHKTVEIAASPELAANQQINDAVYVLAGDVEKLSMQEAGHWWLPLASVVYILGVAFMLIKTACELVSVKRLLAGGEHYPQSDGSILVVLDKDIAPFSWMKWIVMPREDYERGNSHILLHEKAHIAFGHAWNVLLVDLLASLQWFNPTMWYLRSDLRAIFEYEADDAVLRNGANIKEYQYSLIRKAVSESGYSITNSFNHSILKNRITMMSKSKSTVYRGLRALYMLPLLVVALACNSRTETEYKVSENEQESNAMIQEETARTIAFNIDAGSGDTFIYYDGVRIAFDEVATRISSEDTLGLILFTADKDVRLGCIHDVRNELGKYQDVKVKYQCPQIKQNPRKFPNGSETLVTSNVRSGLQCYVKVNDDDRILLQLGTGNNDFAVFDAGKENSMHGFRNSLKSRIKQNPECELWLRFDRGTTFGAYVVIQDIVSSIYDELRCEYAESNYSKSLDQLSQTEIDDIIGKIPLRVYEEDLADVEKRK